MNTNNIWIYEMDYGYNGGIIIADNEENAWMKLARNNNCSVEKLKCKNSVNIRALKSINLNNDVYSLWDL